MKIEDSMGTGHTLGVCYRYLSIRGSLLERRYLWRERERTSTTTIYENMRVQNNSTVIC